MRMGAMTGRQCARLFMWAPWQWPLWHKKVKVAQSCPTLCDCMDCSPLGSSIREDSPDKKRTGVGCHALLQGIFPTQGLNPGLLHCRQILYLPSHHQSPPRSIMSFCKTTFWYCICHKKDVSQISANSRRMWIEKAQLN